MASQIIVGNVDCEAQCGEPERRSLLERWQSTVVAHRLLWLCRSEHDLCVFPAPIRQNMIAYAADTLQIRLSAANQVFPGNYHERPILLTESIMAEMNVRDRISDLCGGSPDPEVVSYFVDSGLAQFCRRHGLNFRWPDGAALEPLNRKSFFRSLAQCLGVPIAPGRICFTLAELESALIALLPLTGVAIVKQDLAGGGEGNVAVTIKPDPSVHVGTSATYRITKSNPVSFVAGQIFDTLTGDRNTSLVAESYLNTKDVIYSEVRASATAADVSLLNWGGMLMEPKWIGFEIPPPKLAPELADDFLRHSLAIAAKVGQLGYHGRMNCDAIVTAQDELIFTEINVRLGGCTHVDILARRLLGEGYSGAHAIKTRNAVRFGGALDELLAAISDIKFDRNTKRGVIVLTEHLRELGEFECMCIGASAADADDILSSLLARLQT